MSSSKSFLETLIDPNAYYTPTGLIRRTNYQIWEYQSLSKPSYFLADGSIFTEDVPFSSILRYTIDVELVSNILLAPQINIEKHFQQEFSAPSPRIEYPTEPVRPANKRPFDPERHPFPPVLKKRSSISLLDRISSLGLIDLYRWIVAPFDQNTNAKRLAKWKSKCAEIDKINNKKREEHEREYEKSAVVQTYNRAVAGYDSRKKTLLGDFDKATNEWQVNKRNFDLQRLQDIKQSIATDSAVEDALKITINATPFLVRMPRICVLNIDEEKRMIFLEITVPAVSNIDFVQTRQLASSTKRVSVPKREQSNWYNILIYSMLVRAVFDVANSPHAVSFDSIAANVLSQYKNPADGRDKESIIASVVVPTAEAKAIDRQHVDPIETFRAWRGISAKVLSDMIAVQPIVVFDKNDRRIIEGRNVLGGESEGENLAMLDWQEFEHLVRQLFELEFKATGADVRVTQSSRDRGVDCIVFDPDPIRGGKIVIQAKRYTNTVDVSSVRDLFGTVQAEGANRGILVTTSSYGADSYEFAKNKPLTLLDGNNLLALLQKHGFIYRISIPEARKAMQAQKPQ